MRSGHLPSHFDRWTGKATLRTAYKKRPPNGGLLKIKLVG